MKPKEIQKLLNKMEKAHVLREKSEALTSEVFVAMRDDKNAASLQAK